MPPINAWAIVVSVVVSVPLGFIWYGPLFGKKWMALSGIAMPAERPGMDAMARPVLISVVGALLMSFGVASIRIFHDAYFAVGGYAAALSLAFFLWLAFVVPPFLNFSAWEKKPWRLFAINAGYWLVYLLLSAAIICAFS